MRLSHWLLAMYRSSMYTRITESGGRRYLQLVEGHRDETGKVRVKVVANLGRLDKLSPVVSRSIDQRAQSGCWPFGEHCF